MSGSADPRRAMHVQSDVPIALKLRLAGMDAHAHADVDTLGPAPGRKGSLRSHCGGNRVARPRERDEERVALVIDLATGVLVERLAKHTLVLGEDLRVAATQPRQQPRRTLYVTEQKRDGASRKLRHAPDYTLRPPQVKAVGGCGCRGSGASFGAGIRVPSRRMTSGTGVGRPGGGGNVAGVGGAARAGTGGRCRTGAAVGPACGQC